jgi:aromatic ring-opening dioxygenase catalytic subunit (LigB family)
MDPADWDKGRERNRAMYRRLYEVEPPIHPKIAEETLELRQKRYRRIRDGLDFLRTTLSKKKPDALILVGDDQNENFKEDNLPQMSIYLGSEFYTTEPRDGQRQRTGRYRCHSELAHALLHGLVERDFDVSFCKSFPQDELLAHAHGPILRRIMPEADIPVVLVFVNALHVPAPSPQRCYRLGEAMRQIVEQRPAAERVAIYASGGLSHFTAGYPWRFYKGPFGYGSISEEFDREALDWMAHGEGEKLAQLTSEDLLKHGDIEMRSWIVVLGAVGKVPAQVVAYEPFYSGNMAMAVGYWEAERV